MTLFYPMRGRMTTAAWTLAVDDGEPKAEEDWMWAEQNFEKKC